MASRTPHLEKAMAEIGRRIAVTWALRTPRKTGTYRRAIRDSRNIKATPLTVQVGAFARKEVGYAKYVEDGHRAFHLPKRIRTWDISKKGTQYKRLAFKPAGSSRTIVRTITPRSKGWHIPRMIGQKNIVEVPKLLRKEIKEKLKKAALKDGREWSKVELTRMLDKKIIKVKIAR